MNPIKFYFIIAKRRLMKRIRTRASKIFWGPKYEWAMQKQKEIARMDRSINLILYTKAHHGAHHARIIGYLKIIMFEIDNLDYFDSFYEYKRLGGFSNVPTE